MATSPELTFPSGVSHRQEGPKMTGNNGPNGGISLLLGGLLMLLMIFLIAGGEMGKKNVRGDGDMPPISSPEKNFR